MLLGKLGASLLENLLAGRGVTQTGEEAIREWVTTMSQRLGQDFNATSSFD